MSGARRARATRRLLATLMVVASVAFAVAAATTGAAKAPAPKAAAARKNGSPLDSFPAGAGKAIADRACLFCHSAMLVTQQAKDSTAWEKTLTTMKNWGAPLEPADRDTLRNYLLARFGPRLAPR